ncbi:hypothetical protein HSBAA_38700 [Vreelandella sulfidaeris]|uniref:Uncharacterized protein n=1 Tax=Vreelandella sulfidaeris TaxID=115553 RepID=A0A455UHX5_9GAMM|nr:hypothetical protein HSBAA_38700 [Halomonas sulfidaeris]
MAFTCRLANGGSVAYVAGHGANPSPNALVLNIEGAIGPATKDYFERGLNNAREQDSEVVIVEIDTLAGWSIPHAT